MKRLLAIMIMLGLPGVLRAEETVSVPWDEYRLLLRESIERKLMEKYEAQPKAKQPQVYTITDAVYQLAVGERTANGHVLISGKMLKGDPEPIPLFSDDVIIAEVEKVTGGSLLCGQGNQGKIAFLPGTTNEFQLVATFLVPVQEDSKSRFVQFHVPRSLRNSLSLKLAGKTQLLESPGVPDAKGVHHFSANSSMLVRFSAAEDIAAAAVAEVDSLSWIKLQGKRAMVITHFLPVRSLPPKLVLEAPAGSAYVWSSLKRSSITQRSDSTYELALPPESRDLFSVQFALKESGKDGSFAFALPKIRDNNGKAGNFIIEEPDDGQVSLAGDKTVSHLSTTGLRSPLRDMAGKRRSYLRTAANGAIAFQVKRYESVSTPPIVLDSLHFFSSFEENGNVLSVLSLQVPAEVGPRLRLKAVAGAQVWRLTVNGQRKDVYSDGSGVWIVPLNTEGVSDVQLAFLRKGDKLGLRGKLESEIPETGLPANEVLVGVALPENKQLLSLEGPLSPDGQRPWKAPKEFLGRKYFFSSKFHKGESMTFAVSYRELTQEEAERMPVALIGSGDGPLRDQDK